MVIKLHVRKMFRRSTMNTNARSVCDS